MEDTKISRRQFLGGAAAVVGAAALPTLMSAAPAVATPTLAIPIPTPGTWIPLDPKAAGRLAYEIYKGQHAPQSACCEATYWGVVAQLAANYPDTWGLVPKGLFNYGGGGVSGYGSICGCPNAGSAILGQIGAPSNVKMRLMRWYEVTVLPTNAARLDYASGTWTPGGTSGGVWGGSSGCPIPANNLPKSKAESVLCHVSLTKWRAAADEFTLAANFDHQQNRCAALCYGVAYFMAQLLNDWKAGVTIDGAVSPAASATGCKNPSCHGSSPTDPLCDAVTAQGSMNCKPCHTGL